MKFKNVEKKIYELLGVNIFRKYVLFTYEKICKKMHFDNRYSLRSISIEGIKFQKTMTVAWLFTHFVLLILLLNYWQLLILNVYCIMTQRYNYIRIDEILEKYNAFQMRKEEKQEVKEEMVLEDVPSADSMISSQKAQTKDKKIEISFIETSYWEPLEQENENFDDGFTRRLNK